MSPTRRLCVIPTIIVRRGIRIGVAVFRLYRGVVPLAAPAVVR